MARYAVGYTSYDILDTKTLPFKAHVSLSADDIGKAVTMVADYTVGLGSSGDPIVGKLAYWENDSTCTVEIGPVLNFTGVSGSLPDEEDVVVCNGSGYVIEGTSATVDWSKPKRYVIGVDSSTLTVTVLM